MAITSSINAAEGGTFSLGGDLSINRLGYGAMRLSGQGIWGEVADREGAKALLRRAVELGINFIDTADSYGPALNEQLIGEALSPYESGVVVATKGGFTRQGPNRWMPVGRPEYLAQQVEMSLRHLKVQRIDLYQLHRIDPKVPVEESLGVLGRLQKQGKIRHIGLSEVKVEELERANKTVKIVSVQNEYNIGNRKSEAVLEYCEQNNIGFIPWYPIGAGDLAKPGGVLAEIAERHEATVAQLALAWLLHRSPVLLPIPGTTSIEHLEENTAAAGLELTDEEWNEIEAAAAKK